jgi:protein involved in polysaccharide export with SLBB domain
LARIKKELAIINAMRANAKKSAAMTESANSLDEVMVEAKKYEPIGRVSIKLDENLTAFETSSFNLTLKDKDTIIIPSQIDTVTVFGEVFNPTSFVYNQEKSLEDYIAMASGYSRTADESSVYVIHADGTSEPIYGGWFSAAVEIKKGDTIVVPIYIKENNALDVWDSVAKILASFALTAAAVNSLGVI